MSTKNHLLIVALDHIPLGVMRGWEQVEDTLNTIIAGTPDFVILNFGILKKFKPLFEGETKTILRLDGSPSYLVEDWRKASRWDLLYTLDDALRVGAAAVIVYILVGGLAEMPSVLSAAKVASACLERDVPLIISAIPSTEIIGHSEIEVATFAARLAAEIGGDIVNTYFGGDLADLSSIVSLCPVPVILAGGSPKSDKETIHRAYLAIQAGCAGICFGRSIWQSKTPLLLMQSLHEILHNSLPLDETIAKLVEKKRNLDLADTNKS